MENLVTLTVRSTHFYLFETAGGRLLIDNGWAGSLPALRAELKRYQFDVGDIDYLLITHCHPDHAGLTQEIKQAGKARLIIHPVQIPFLQELGAYHQDKASAAGEYVPVTVDREDIVLPESQGLYSGASLHSLGISGEVLLTPGHSADSISFVTTGGLAFVGDLTQPAMAAADKAATIAESWWRLITRGATTFYPGHGEPFERALIDPALREIS